MAKEVGRIIERGLKQRGWRQVDLERAFADRGDKLPSGLVNHWLKSRRVPSLARGLMLAELLGFEPELLAGRRRVA